MRYAHILLALAVAGVLLAGSAQPVSAAPFAIPANDSVIDTESAQAEGMITVSWYADADITVVLKDPSGAPLRSVTDDIGSFTQSTETSGEYTVEWINENNFAVDVDGEIVAIDLSPEDIFDAVGTIILIVALSIIAIIVVVVLVVMYASRSDRRQMQQSQLAQPPMAYVPPPPAPGTAGAQSSGPTSCPMCRAQIDSSMAFCQRCGAKLR